MGQRGMRIVHVSPHLPPDQAANALLPAQLGQWMADRGDRVAFVAHESAHAQGPGPRAVGLPVQWIPRRESSGLRRLLKIDAWQLVGRVRGALNRVARDADLLHLHSNGLIIEAAASWARRQRKPYVLTLYGTEIWHYKKRPVIDPFTKAYRGAARLTFYSQRLMERAKTEGLDREGVAVVYPPVAGSFTPRQDPERDALRRELGIAEPLMVLNVKRLHPLAGQQFLVEAFAQIVRARRDVRLIICGDGSLRDELASQTQTLGITDRVTLTGLLPNDTVAKYMAVADVFALPSRLEAMPTVAVEALASGTPVISADHPGGVELREIFGDDVIVVPRESVGPLARALEGFLAQPRRTTPATAASLDRLFRPPAVIRAFSEIYAQTVQAPG
jgi:glycosyltransferase involved in cell wall biosynthesis